MCRGDKLSARKGHRYVSVFCDLIGKRVLFASPGKDKCTWEKSGPSGFLVAWGAGPKAGIEE